MPKTAIVPDWLYILSGEEVGAKRSVQQVGVRGGGGARGGAVGGAPGVGGGEAGAQVGGGGATQTHGRAPAGATV
eukprot:50335-Prorocentrum_minimum.AAC.2